MAVVFGIGVTNLLCPTMPEAPDREDHISQLSKSTRWHRRTQKGAHNLFQSEKVSYALGIAYRIHVGRNEDGGGSQRGWR